jgi:hypothetical protein
MHPIDFHRFHHIHLDNKLLQNQVPQLFEGLPWENIPKFRLKSLHQYLDYFSLFDPIRTSTVPFPFEQIDWLFVESLFVLHQVHLQLIKELIIHKKFIFSPSHV